MVLHMFGTSVELLLGALGGLLGTALGLQICPHGQIRVHPVALCEISGLSLVIVLVSVYMLLASSWFSFFAIVSYALMGNLRAGFELHRWHAEPRNITVNIIIPCIAQGQRFRDEAYLESVLELLWVTLGCSRGALGNTFGLPDRPTWAEALWPFNSLGSIGSVAGLLFLCRCPSSRLILA